MIQLVSHVLPPSGEKACSQRADFSVIRDQMKRTWIGRPSKTSSHRNVPTPALEGAAHRNIDGRRVAAVDPPDRPLSRRRIEGSQRGGTISAVRQFNQIVVHIAEAAKDRAHFACPAKRVPVRVAREPLAQPSMADIPAPEEEIEIGPAICRDHRRNGWLLTVSACAIPRLCHILPYELLYKGY